MGGGGPAGAPGAAEGAAAEEASKANLAFERLIPHLANDAKVA